jgi:hypothetical protein
MHASEARALGHLGGRAVGGVAGWAEEMHRTIAGQVFATLGLVARPVRQVHDVVAGGSYAALRTTAEAVGDVSGALLAKLAGDAPMTSTPVGGQAIAALDALLGDRLEEQGSPLALPMSLRSRGEDIPLDRDALEAAFPEATSRVLLLVHGLGETDLSWIGRDDEGRPWSYAHALEPHGWTGATVRYNTGRRIAASGASLAALVDDVVAAWPVPVTDLALVGHSMGGLVIRSACATAAVAGRPWPSLVRSCVYLGSPHHGASLERGVNVLGWLLGHVTHVRPVASVLRLRSAGIKDLRYGLITDDGWEEDDVDGLLTGTGTGAEVALLASARHHLVAAHIGSSERHPAAVLLGDLLVRPGSALGLGHRKVVALDPCERMTLASTNHFGLLKDRKVAEALVGWLT